MKSFEVLAECALFYPERYVLFWHVELCPMGIYFLVGIESMRKCFLLVSQGLSGEDQKLRKQTPSKPEIETQL